MKIALYLSGCILMIAVAIGALVVAKSISYATVQFCESLKSTSDSVAIVAAQSIALRSSVAAQATAVGQDANSTVKQFLTVADRRIGETLTRADRALSVFEGIRGDLQPTLAALPPAVAQAQGTLYAASETLASGGSLLDRYRLVPDEVGARLQPTFLALEPEFTCRTVAGDGYGGCWHSRVTALMGEAARVGGVFTQRFPEMADSVTGIAADAHGWTSKYVQPHPMKLADYFKGAGRLIFGAGVAALHGGVF